MGKGIDKVEKIFNDKYSSNGFPLNKIYVGKNVPQENIRLYNWNLRFQIGPVSYPIIWFEEILNEEITKIYSLCYEYFKLLKKGLRKQK